MSCWPSNEYVQLQLSKCRNECEHTLYVHLSLARPLFETFLVLWEEDESIFHATSPAPSVCMLDKIYIRMQALMNFYFTLVLEQGGMYFHQQQQQLQ